MHLKVFPLSTALRPSRWYEALRTYKTTHPERGWLLASVVSSRLPLALLRSGRIMIVPSTQQPAPHPLLHVLKSALCGGVTASIHHRGGAIQRHAYHPEVFATDGVTGARVVLFDDLWVSGATMMSAAGALLRDGAASVTLIPVARHVALQYYGRRHPYVRLCQGEVA
ncbi:MAG TPA: phosphoribosyltransferase [Thermoanaerobaculia bacterium]|nr:phosphoribosyltransferase [Thermoanaerobaculia bacterium]